MTVIEGTGPGLFYFKRVIRNDTEKDYRLHYLFVLNMPRIRDLHNIENVKIESAESIHHPAAEGAKVQSADRSSPSPTIEPVRIKSADVLSSPKHEVTAKNEPQAAPETQTSSASDVNWHYVIIMYTLLPIILTISHLLLKGRIKSVEESEHVEVTAIRPVGPRKEDIFESIDEDVDLMKVLVDFNVEKLVGVGADDKRALDAAQKILKVAYKEKAFEKTLTKEENDVLSKFFSGKIPYDHNVLQTLDNVLDKTIEYFDAHKTNLDPETKALIHQRQAVCPQRFLQAFPF
ncbi:hypothetical protein DICVIV_08205 [Dictyocaulus viviparus]|uniref:Uncharacterized protein n=1 Tax=Dictyocaulus viviparus TaxID=29172 RepID=A0A0D8XMI7_DICVI|nr:hypothetical protein DICVIV_08205 [Dictyocaulus viviparus]